MTQMSDLLGWLQTLDAPFAFLLALPFVVAAAGLIAMPFQRRMERRR